MRVRRRRIERLVREVLSDSDVVDAPVPVEQIARRCGLDIRFQPLDSDLSGILFPAGQRAVVGVNSSHAKVRQRFTIAHELGHFLLHKNDQLRVDRTVQPRFRSRLSSAGTDVEEIEANWFAAELLMPRTWIKGDAASLRDVDVLSEDDVRRLARRYAVSTQALVVRLVNLGYIEQ